MATTICVKRVDATLDNGVWSCPDESLAAYLQAVLTGCRRNGCPATEEMEALWVSNRVGGAVIPKLPTAPHGTPAFRRSTSDPVSAP